LARFELESGTFQLFYLYLCFVGESRFLVSWCAGGRCGMAFSDENRGRSRRPGVEDRDGHTCRVLSGRAIERSGDVECGLHRARGDEKCGFLG
jgi:hypothetical protein